VFGAGFVSYFNSRAAILFSAANIYAHVELQCQPHFETPAWFNHCTEINTCRCIIGYASATVQKAFKIASKRFKSADLEILHD